MSNSDPYYEKYTKYKQKYLQLKDEQNKKLIRQDGQDILDGGALLMTPGLYAVFSIKKTLII